MHAGDFACIRVHSTRRLTGLDVSPDHWTHVALIVHEARIEIRGIVGIGRCDVGAAAREGVLQEMEHGEEFTWRHQHMVAKEPANNQHRQGKLVLLITHPAMTE